MGILAIIASCAFIVLYLPFGPGAGLGMHEWMMVALWTVIGIILYIITKGSLKRTRGRTGNADFRRRLCERGISGPLSEMVLICRSLVIRLRQVHLMV